MVKFICWNSGVPIIEIGGDFLLDMVQIVIG